MRSIIFTSVVCEPARAPMTHEMPTFGFFARDYFEAHMTKRLTQVVSSMITGIYEKGDFHFTAIAVVFADEGQAGQRGLGVQRLNHHLDCQHDGQRQSLCGVECDGGSFIVSREDARGAGLQTEYLMIGDIEGCGGAAGSARMPCQVVRYRLNRVADAKCGGM